MEKPKKTEFRRFSSNMQQVTYHFQYFGHAELIFDVRFVKLSSLPSQKLLKLGKRKAYCTEYSQAVTHPSTNSAQCCLTSVIRRELVYSTWYGSRQGLQVQSTSQAKFSLKSGYGKVNGESSGHTKFTK